MTEVEKSFKDQERTKDMMKNLGSVYDNQFSLDYIAKVSPVLEEESGKCIGSGPYIIEYVCHKD
jgi:glutathione S-transferase